MKRLFVILLLAAFAASCGSEKTCPPPGIGDDCTDECAEGLECIDGTCTLVLKSRGEACREATECSSGFCVDSVCCESECAEGCMTCNGANPGRCEADTAPECSVKYPEDATTIQDAIDSVGDGGVIVIGQGTDENIVIETDKAVVIEGDEQNPPEITANDGQTAIHIKDGASVTIRNVQIRGGSRGVQVSAPVPVLLERVHVRDAEVAVEVDHGAVWVPEAVTQLLSCDLFDNTKAGLVVRSAPVDVTGSRLHGNMRALQAENTQAFNLTGTIVSQSHGNFGATFKDSDHIVIDGSLFWENNGLGGVVFKTVTDSEVKNSTFNGNGTAGIQVISSSAIDIVDVTILDHVDTFINSIKFNLPSEAVDLGDLELDGFMLLPKTVFAPLDIVVNFGDDYWQGNGISINESDDILIASAFLKGNQGSGVLIRNSTNIIVWEGAIFQNARSGVAAYNTDSLWVTRAGTYHNHVAAVQAAGGSSVVEYTSLSAAYPDDQGKYGYGFSAEGGHHWVDYNYIYSNDIAGIIMNNNAEVHFTGNEIHDSEWAVIQGVGCLPHEGVNEVSCTIADPCVEWHDLDGAPSPPPALPIDP
jgi:hypothetical protein